MNEIDFQLYLITDRKQTKGQELLPALEAALQGGVRAVQLREKDLSDREVFELGCEIRKLTRRYGARLFINDRADLALAVKADGVHLTQTSYPAGEARKIIGKSGIIGVSTHSLHEARKAEEDGADFITLGPVFETPSKMVYGPPVGLSTLEQVIEAVTIPVFAIGGIKKENILSAIHAGAHGIALISGILVDSNVKQAAKEFISVAASTHPAENKHTANR
jgi:thiamine-phosphate pyrophosphorylase